MTSVVLAQNTNLGASTKQGCASAMSKETSHECVAPPPCHCKAHRWGKKTGRSVGGVGHNIVDTGSTHNCRTCPCSIVGGREGSVQIHPSSLSVDRSSWVAWRNCQSILLALDLTKTRPPDAVPAGQWDLCWQWRIEGTGLHTVLGWLCRCLENSIE